MEYPKISLIIPAYNEEQKIGACLDSVVKSGKGKFYEIIVVDNASTDNTAKIAESFEEVKVVRENEKGLTKARQKGLETATGDFLAYIDADTKMPVNWLEKAADFFSKNPDTVSLSGPYRYYDGSVLLRIAMTALWYIFAPISYRLVGFAVLGGNFIARKDILIKMGGFDRKIDFYGEDTDIARRISKFGKAVFRMDFFIYSSLRRISEEGFIRTNIKYGLNFLWQVVFHRPFTKKYNDIRINNN